jgi:dUTP pyrophosphatase
MKINVKKLHKDAVIPKYAKPGDAGTDLTATSVEINRNKAIVKFGLAIEIPAGYVGLIFPRSSIHKTDFRLANCVGVIDSGYRGEISAVFDIRGSRLDGETDAWDYKVGDRVAQIIIMPYPEVEFATVDNLSTTERGGGGYGSTGK